MSRDAFLEVRDVSESHHASASVGATHDAGWVQEPVHLNASLLLCPILASRGVVPLVWGLHGYKVACCRGTAELVTGLRPPRRCLG